MECHNELRVRAEKVLNQLNVKGGVILGHGVLLLSDSVLANCQAKMSP